MESALPVVTSAQISDVMKALRAKARGASCVRSVKDCRKAQKASVASRLAKKKQAVNSFAA